VSVSLPLSHQVFPLGQHITPATRHLGLPPATRDAAMLSHRFSHRCLHHPSAHGRDAVAPLPLPPLVSFL